MWLSQPEAFRRKGWWAAELWPAHVICQGPGSSASDPQVCKVQLKEPFLLPSPPAAPGESSIRFCQTVFGECGLCHRLECEGDCHCPRR